MVKNGARPAAWIGGKPSKHEFKSVAFVMALHQPCLTLPGLSVLLVLVTWLPFGQLFRALAEATTWLAIRHPAGPVLREKWPKLLHAFLCRQSASWMWPAWWRCSV